jgi:hypothetical protein
VVLSRDSQSLVEIGVMVGPKKRQPVSVVQLAQTLFPVLYEIILFTSFLDLALGSICVAKEN